MRTGSTEISVQTVPVRRAPIEAAEDARIVIDFPTTPDDVRLRAQSTSRMERAGCVQGVVGIVSTAVGVAALSLCAYLALDAAAEVEDTPAADNRRVFGYSFAGGVGLLSAMATTFGLSQLCVCLRKRREARGEMNSQNTYVHFSTRAQQGGAYDHA